LREVSPRSSDAVARETREAIVEQALLVASVEGFDGVTIGGLAGELGLSKAGVVGPFGSKQALQLAAFKRGIEQFVELVWVPVATLPAGLPRLQGICEQWIRYHERRTLPGGCVVTTASVEFDSRDGALRDAVADAQRRWLATLAADAEVAVRAGELPADTDPDELALLINGLAMSLNQALLLFDDADAPGRARRAVARLLGQAPLV
jgi:AcrR family transcriptional regulator